MLELLIEFLPFGALLGRIKWDCNISIRRKLYICILKDFAQHLFYEVAIIYPSLYLLIFGLLLDINSFLVYSLVYFALWILLHTIYDIFYVMNDYIFIKYEESPTIRKYLPKNSVKKTIVLRLVYAIMLLFILINNFKMKFMLLFATIILVLMNILHNFANEHLRIFTFGSLRLAKWLFIPLIIKCDSVPYILLLLLPCFHDNIIKYYQHKFARKYMFVSKFDVPLWERFIIYLPLQFLVVYPNIYVLFPNIIIVIFSIIFTKIKDKGVL